MTGPRRLVSIYDSARWWFRHADRIFPELLPLSAWDGISEPMCFSCGWVPDWQALADPTTPRQIEERIAVLRESAKEESPTRSFLHSAEDHIAYWERRLARFKRLSESEQGRLVLKHKWHGHGGTLHRAHLVEHMHGGSGDAWNLMPMCQWCHRVMTKTTMFEQGDWLRALTWVRARSRVALNEPMYHRRRMAVMRYDGKVFHTPDGYPLFKRDSWDLTPQGEAYRRDQFPQDFADWEAERDESRSA